MFREVPATSANLTLLNQLTLQEDAVHAETDAPFAVLTLPDTWDAYVRSLKPRFRTKVRSVLRNAETRPEITFGFCEREDEIAGMLGVLFDLHTKRWAEEAMPGVFRWDRKRQFYQTLTPLLLDRGWLRFSWMAWQGRVIACQYGFVYGDTYFHLQEGYEPACQHWNAGIALRAWTIREFQKQGVHEYDFLGGVSRHKTDWGAEARHSKHVVIARPTARNMVFCRGPEWERRVRDVACDLVPASIMAARRQRLARTAVAAFERTPNGSTSQSSGGDWIRQAFAKCYCDMHGPALVRRLRERYQLSISRTSRVPAISWTKRNRPSARILYYHRINNDNDPFFPATPTDVFEQQMRFIARNYNVVSLASMLERLETGYTEPMLAITFDDGYRDNYDNALPILRRYGLPATIFLTTGGIDSREPLWFEELAGAIKGTERDYIDIEIDIPRRFPLRTVPERLKANGDIFALMRKLPDPERRQWLGRIVSNLEWRGGVRRDQMLTWDQVRHMHKENVAFGAHTVTHPFLSKMTRDDVAWEVSESKRRIEQELQSPVQYFAYPNGRQEDFAPFNKEVIRSAGYSAAVTTIWGVNSASTDRMELRRGQPWEETASMFACKLDWYELIND
jgi:peptidoglycan/xylan/chitin deacetylase (PgdA/CDA1 family)